MCVSAWLMGHACVLTITVVVAVAWTENCLLCQYPDDQPGRVDLGSCGGVRKGLAPTVLGL